MNPYTVPADSFVEDHDAGFQIVRYSLPRRILGGIVSVSTSLLPLVLPSLFTPGYDLTRSWTLLGFPLILVAGFTFSPIHGWWKNRALETRLWSHPITQSGRALYGGVGTIRPPRGGAAGDYIFVTADSLVFGIELPGAETTQWMALSLGSIRSVSRLRWFFNLIPRMALHLDTDSGVFTLDSTEDKLWLRLIEERIEEAPLIPPWPESRKPVEWSQ